MISPCDSGDAQRSASPSGERVFDGGRRGRALAGLRHQAVGPSNRRRFGLATTGSAIDPTMALLKIVTSAGPLLRRFDHAFKKPRYLRRHRRREVQRLQPVPGDQARAVRPRSAAGTKFAEAWDWPAWQPEGGNLVSSSLNRQPRTRWR